MRGGQPSAAGLRVGIGGEEFERHALSEQRSGPDCNDRISFAGLRRAR
jgi:hypothetical protein